jgi:feruloyl esterase
MARQEAPGRPAKRVFRVAAPALAACAIASALPAHAALPGCTLAALNGLGVPGVSVVAAVDVPAGALPSTNPLSPNPEFCDVQGVLTTTGYGAPNGSALFELQLPATWNQKLLFWGVGGTAGSTYGDFAANGVDFTESLDLGFATAITDTGHEANNTDAAWALTSSGAPDTAKVVDYYFRATHEMTAAAKAIVRGYYKAPSIKRAYFDGCSNGGRQAMVEASHFPEDYDGIIAGAPFMDIRAIIAGTKQEKENLSPGGYLPASLLPMIDAAVLASCDAADGLKDGLIQNPGNCSFDPQSLVCKSGQTSGCLTPGQASTLSGYWGALRDERGRVIYPGATVSDLTGGMDVWTLGFFPPGTLPGSTAAEPFGPRPATGPWLAPVVWQFTDDIIKYLVERSATFDLFNFPVSTGGVVTDNGLALFDARTEAGDGDRPGRLLPFIYQNRKLLMYHGLSDPALPPFRTVKYYEQLASLRGGYDKLQENVRLFLVPDMQHCGGGPGPNLFDTVRALDAWTESGTGPDGITAAHANSAAPGGFDRTMPLCKFPEQAVYGGTGPVPLATSWSCTDNTKMLEVGPDGERAGLSPQRSDDDGKGSDD